MEVEITVVETRTTTYMVAVEDTEDALTACREARTKFLASKD
jgi:hypothetical protein